MNGVDEEYRRAARIAETSVPILEKMGVRITAMRDRFVRVELPMAPNVNHLGAIYAGSLFSLAEFTGGAVFVACFDYQRFIPIAKEMRIRFKRVAATDMHIEVEMPKEWVADAIAAADASEKGKADFELDLLVKDADGQVCCEAHGTWQLRKVAG